MVRSWPASTVSQPSWAPAPRLHASDPARPSWSTVMWAPSRFWTGLTRRMPRSVHRNPTPRDTVFRAQRRSQYLLLPGRWSLRGGDAGGGARQRGPKEATVYRKLVAYRPDEPCGVREL